MLDEFAKYVLRAVWMFISAVLNIWLHMGAQVKITYRAVHDQPIGEMDHVPPFARTY